MVNLDLNNYSHFSERLGKTAPELENELGQPIKTTIEENDTLSWYGSIAAQKATIYRFQNFNVAWVQTDVSTANLTLDEFLNVFGDPELSVVRYEGGQDSLRMKVVAWPTQGREVIVMGDDRFAKVARFAFFREMSKEEYEVSFGHKTAQNTKVDLMVESKIKVPQAQPKQTIETQHSKLIPDLPEFGTSSQQMLYQGMLIAILIGVITSLYLIQKKSKKK